MYILYYRYLFISTIIFKFNNCPVLLAMGVGMRQTQSLSTQCLCLPGLKTTTKKEKGGLEMKKTLKLFQTTNWAVRSVKIWSRNKHQGCWDGWLHSRLYPESADENIFQSWFSLTCALATNLLVILSASLSNQRHNFLLCRQMTALVSLLRCFFFHWNWDHYIRLYCRI